MVSCEFSNPVNASGTAPIGDENWQFKNASCTPAYISLIDDGAGSHFYLDERFSYGDIFLGLFVIFFCLAYVFGVVWRFLVPISIKALTKNDL
jgi:hypothetical protein